ncbi:MAG TPA: S9 family peptidase [Nannocystaceae bacterium]|nr:S9 family peptidase [Nannocystaceae bacterium]
MNEPTPPPVAEERPHSSVVHGRVRSDPYAWLRDREDPEVRAHLERENAYADAMMADTRELQDVLYREMVARIREADETVPVKDGPFLYYARTEAGRNYAVHCRRPVDGEVEQIYLDENALAQGRDFFVVREVAVDPAHRVVAFAADESGDERYTIRFRDIDTQRDLPDVIPAVGHSVAWSRDGAHVFYLRIDDAQRPFEVWRHALGSAVADDVRVHVEPDHRFHLSLARGRSRRFVYVTAESRSTSEVWFLPADDAAAAPRLVAARREGIEYAVADHGERFFVLTNHEAREFRIATAAIATPDVWQPFVEHRADTHLERIDAFADHLVIALRRDGVPQLRVVDLATGDAHELDMPEPSYSIHPGQNPEYATSTLRFHYASMVTPPSVFDYDMRTRRRELRKLYEVHGYDPALLVTERVHATAPDGVRVPITIVRRRADVGRAQPVLLMGYGAYGRPLDAWFSWHRLSLVDRGIAVAIAHVRGGGDLGRAWYDDGKLLKKRNTFTDFIACAEHLVAQGVASRLAIHGGSAGGLLVGAVLNARPDLFTAAIADVPFVDVLDTMLDPSLPLTVIEREEWGDPHELAYFDYIESYSPCDNVGAHRYPHVLALAGWNDPRVGYWEPAKWVAKLRALGLPGAEILLRTNLGAGHGGPSGRYPAIAHTAFIWAFLLKHLGA